MLHELVLAAQSQPEAAGLILRGVAFEFRHKAEKARWIWNTSFAAGSDFRIARHSSRVDGTRAL